MFVSVQPKPAVSLFRETNLYVSDSVELMPVQFSVLSIWNEFRRAPKGGTVCILWIARHGILFSPYLILPIGARWLLSRNLMSWTLSSASPIGAK